MPAIHSILPEKLARLIGTPNCPMVIDVRSEAEQTAAGGAVPASVHRPAAAVSEWGPSLAVRRQSWSVLMELATVRA